MASGFAKSDAAAAEEECGNPAKTGMRIWPQTSKDWRSFN